MLKIQSGRFATYWEQSVSILAVFRSCCSARLEPRRVAHFRAKKGSFHFEMVAIVELFPDCGFLLISGN